MNELASLAVRKHNLRYRFSAVRRVTCNWLRVTSEPKLTAPITAAGLVTKCPAPGRAGQGRAGCWTLVGSESISQRINGTQCNNWTRVHIVAEGALPRRTVSFACGGDISYYCAMT